MNTANAFTWACTVAEVAVGAWMVLHMGWDLAGGVVIGLAMGTQFSRVMRPIAQQLGISD